MWNTSTSSEMWTRLPIFVGEHENIKATVLLRVEDVLCIRDDGDKVVAIVQLRDAEQQVLGLRDMTLEQFADILSGDQRPEAQGN